MFRLAHLSDPHLGPLPPVRIAELVSKRIFGFVNWQRRSAYHHHADVVAALTADLATKGFDHLAVTGDLVNIGLTAEFVAARSWLLTLGTPENVSVIPGNHDEYVPGSRAHMLEVWDPFIAGDDATPGDPPFPYVRRRGPIAIVGVSSAVATAPLMATGTISQGQAAALTKKLGELAGEDVFRVVLIHHPPVVGTTSWHRRLIGAKRFRAAIAEAGAGLILYGHNHRTHVSSLPGPSGPVPVVGATAASLLPKPGRHGGSYVLYDIEKRDGRFHCAMTEYGIRSRNGSVEKLSEREL
jgi:3',5'-cyclic AMP phosphodiesterase CpdA